MMGPKPLLGGVELGGTKCICFIGTAPDDIREQVSVPTGSEPQTALRRIVEQLNHWQSLHGRIAALGIASFGPVDLAARSSTYGFITSTVNDCVEGLASGTAIAARAGTPAERVPADSPVWQTVAHALAQLLHTIVLATAPRRIILGGGVAQSRPELLPRVRTLLLQSLNGYLALEEIAGPIEEYIVAPGLGSLSGPLGALALATDAYRSASRAVTC